MNARTVTADAVMEGSLQFAIVQQFTGDDSELSEDAHVESSSEPSGIARLMDGTILTISYGGGRTPMRDEDGTCRFSERDDTEPILPYAGCVVMVDAADGHARRWTWPSLILPGCNVVHDNRYLVHPKYPRTVQYRGLHCLVNLDDTDPGLAEEMIRNPSSEFPAPAVYVGMYAGDFIKRAQVPYALGAFDWDPGFGESQFAGLAIKLR